MRVALALFACAVSACAPNLPAISARIIDCPEQDVRVTDEDLNINNSSWTATCHGEIYRCHGQDNLITCHPAAGGVRRAMAVPPPAPMPPPPMMH
jgi:hypothetical protein